MKGVRSRTDTPMIQVQILLNRDHRPRGWIIARHDLGGPDRDQRRNGSGQTAEQDDGLLREARDRRDWSP